MRCHFLGLFTIPPGKKGTFSYEVSCKKIPDGQYVILITGYSKGGNYVQDGDREILTLDNIEMGSGTQAALSCFVTAYQSIPKS